jgi:hypothetical protein
MKKGEKKEKPTPQKCVCGRPAIIVKTRHGKMATCPDPMNCPGNLRTTWKRSEDLAIIEWNGLVSTFVNEMHNTRRQ